MPRKSRARIQWLSAFATAILVTAARDRAVLCRDEAIHKADANALRQAAMNSGGNADRGRTIYQSAAARCESCHKVNGQGGEVGPDLSQIGGKFDPTHLIESILDPSAEILQGYQATVIESKSGRVVTGIVKSESATAVTLVDAEGKRITI